MNSIPNWWLILSGVFFALAVLLLFALLATTLYLISAIRELSVQVKAVGQRAQAIAERVEAVTDQARTTSLVVGGHARNIGANVDNLVEGIATKAQFVGSLLLGWMVLKRLVGRGK